jgi:hypothetical protein
VKNKPKSIALLIAYLFLFGSLQSCFLFSNVKNKKSESIADTHEQQGFSKATIINYTIDGCTFMIQLEDGKKLEPTNLQDTFKKDNFKVWIKYQHYKGNSICMAGEMITITGIEKR